MTKVFVVGILFLLIVSSVPLTGVGSHSKEVKQSAVSQYEQYKESWYVKGTNDELKNNVVQLSVVINEKSTTSGGGPMDSAWPMQSHDVYHTGLSPYSTANNSGAEKWRFYTGGEIEGSSAVIDKNGTIYFGTLGSEHTLFAFYPNGTRRWSYKATALIWSTPALAEDGTIYFGTWGSYPYFHALNQNGTLKWLFATGPSNSPVIAEDGTIYVGSDNSIVWALNPNGTLKWSYDTGYVVMGCPAIGADGTIYIGSGDDYLYALYPNGTLHWRFNTGSVIKGSASIAVDGTIYVPSFNSYFYALYPNNGTLKWKAYTGDSIAAAGVALASDGTIYVGTELLRAYYPNGTLKWSSDVQGDIYGTVPAVSADGTIYVSAGLDLVAVNPDGTERWRHQVAEYNAYSSPCIGADGSVYVGSTWGGGAWVYGCFHAFGIGPLRVEAGGPYSGLASDTPVQFSGLVFGGRPPYTYQWDFGDGNTSTEQNPIHMYRNIGTYNVMFTVTDSEGNTSSDNATAIISYGPPLISFLKPEAAIYIADMKLCPFQFPMAFGKITVKVEASHPFLPIERVEFYKWDKLQTVDTTPPYTWTWTERIPLRGTHKIGITIIAYTSETVGYGFAYIVKFF